VYGALGEPVADNRAFRRRVATFFMEKFPGEDWNLARWLPMDIGAEPEIRFGPGGAYAKIEEFFLKSNLHVFWQHNFSMGIFGC
jgi:hypothetical protein